MIVKTMNMDLVQKKKGYAFATLEKEGKRAKI